MDIKQYRVLVLKRQKVAENKIARMKMQGVDVEGTRYDVRAPNERVARYTRRQLETLHKRVNAFVRTQPTEFVALHKGVAPASAIARLEKAQARFNAIGEKHYNEIKDIELPGPGKAGRRETIQQRDAKFRSPNARRSYGDSMQRPYFKSELDPSGINGEKALNRLTRDLNRRSSPGYLKKEIAKGRYQLLEMLKATGDTELMEMATALTDRQFNVAWNFTNLPTMASLKYTNLKEGDGENFRKTQDDDATSDIRERLEWAGKLFPVKSPKK
jgi:hypothetical protein